VRGRVHRFIAGMGGIALAATFGVACSGSGETGSGSGETGGSIADDYDLKPDSTMQQAGGGPVAQISVGSKNFFAEQEILGHITVEALSAAGAEVEDKTGLGDTETVRASLLSGGIDLYWEYTATGATIHLALPDVPNDPQALYETVAKTDRKENGIEWLDPISADNSYAIAVREEVSDPSSDQYDKDLANVQSISDLARLVKQQPQKATICVGPEFEQRADALHAVESTYGFRFPEENVLGYPVSTVYRAVDNGKECNFGSVFRTSGYLSALGLTMLDDDRGAFPPYSPSLTVRSDVLENYPDLEPLIDDIASRLDDKTLRALNKKVEVDHEAPQAVASEWLESEGLVE